MRLRLRCSSALGSFKINLNRRACKGGTGEVKDSMLYHIRDLGKVVGAASTNVFAAAAKAAVSEPSQAQAIAEHGGAVLHDCLTVFQIVVAVVTIAYIGLKFYRLWENKDKTS